MESTWLHMCNSHNKGLFDRTILFLQLGEGKCHKPFILYIVHKRRGVAIDHHSREHDTMPSRQHSISTSIVIHCNVFALERTLN